MIFRVFELLKLAATGLAVFIVVGLASKSARLRRTMLYLLLFLSFTRIYVTSYLPFLIPLRMPLAFMLLLAFGTTAIDTVRRLTLSGRLIPVFAWTAYLCVSNLLVSTQPSIRVAYEQIGSLFFMIILLCFLRTSTERQIRTILLVIAFACLLNTLLGMDRYIPVLQAYRLSEGVRTTHQVIGQSALHAMIFLLCVLPSFPALRQRAGVILALVASAIGVGLSGARSPTIAYAAVMALWKRRAGWWVTMILIGGVVVLFFQARFVESEFTQDRYTRLVEAFREGRPASVSEVSFRQENVAIALQTFAANPVFGVGMGSWSDLRAQAEGQVGFMLAAHNGWALMAAELGLVGYLLFAWAVWSCVKGLRFRYSSSLIERMGFTGMLGLLSIFITSFGGDALVNRQLYLYLGLSLAAATAGARQPGGGGEIAGGRPEGGVGCG